MNCFRFVWLDLLVIRFIGAHNFGWTFKRLLMNTWEKLHETWGTVSYSLYVSSRQMSARKNLDQILWISIGL